ncbi:hypothetical protein CRG98_036820 [Punica granatum]|uniref:Uncharacterized protein n=1 Tax=Punica granatum TaxID=22663 RepID=A0A2I0IHJ6_PUNGR|nr:hypothetical protein CRG98_036820 [Punica granatum]
MYEGKSRGRVDPVKRKWMIRRLCTVVWLSDRDHLFTGESEDYEEPFKRDGTTRRSRGRKWHVVEVRVHPVNGLGSRWCSRSEREVGDFELKI